MLRVRALCLAGALADVACADLVGVEDWRSPPDAGVGAAQQSTPGSGGAAGGVAGAAGARDCWHGDPTRWSSIHPADVSGIGSKLFDPRLSSDGLTLHYTGAVDGLDGGTVLRPFRATRPDLGASFSSGALLGAWPAIGSVSNPTLASDERELVVDDNDDLLVASWNGGAWSDPVKLGAPVSSGTYDRNASLSADGTRMVFERQDGEPAEVIGTTYRLHEAVRSAPVRPGAPFEREAPLSLPPTTSKDALFCATLSSDGLRLFFGSTYPLVVSEANKSSAVTVWYAERAGLGAPWGEAVHLASLDSFTANSCPSAVTGDGCELWVVRSNFSGLYAIDVARRVAQ